MSGRRQRGTSEKFLLTQSTYAAGAESEGSSSSGPGPSHVTQAPKESEPLSGTRSQKKEAGKRQLLNRRVGTGDKGYITALSGPRYRNRLGYPARIRGGYAHTDSRYRWCS